VAHTKVVGVETGSIDTINVTYSAIVESYRYPLVGYEVNDVMNNPINVNKEGNTLPTGIPKSILKVPDVSRELPVLMATQTLYVIDVKPPLRKSE